MKKGSNKNTANDFVARDISKNRICVRGRNDKFKAIKRNGKWKKGYPEFDDLMDNFSEVNDLAEIQMFSSEARISL